MSRNFLLITFCIISFLEVIGEFASIKLLTYSFKPLLMPSLLVWYLLSAKEFNIKPQAIIVISLIFSFLGDTFLLFTNISETYFLLGLGSFLVAQLAYAFAFFKDKKNNNLSKNYKSVTLIIFGIYISGLFLAIYKNLNDFTIPVVIYAIAVSFMGIAAAFRKESVNIKSYRLTFVGALLFVISDTVIAIDKFAYNSLLPFASVAIMVLYISGQFLIIKGLLLKSDNE